MKNKKKKAFTLVELLAVIVILAVILVIAIPQIMKVIKASRLSAIKDSAILIAEQADKDFISQQVLNKDYSETSIPCSDVAKLNEDYASCKIAYNNGVATVKLKGKEGGKFSGIICTGTKDNMNCKEKVQLEGYTDAVEYFTNLCDNTTGCNDASNTSGLIKTNGTELRYRGSNPNNYVTFNDEVAGWRIVGIFDGRVKLVRKDSLGGYSWDSSESTINNGYGVNEWSESDLMNELNGDYLNFNLSSNTTWYDGLNNKKTATFDKSEALNFESQNLIDDAVWNLGGILNNRTISLEDVYAYERGNVTCQEIGTIGCVHGTKNDGVERTTSWIGKVGLIYPSDYGYSSGNTSCKENIYIADNCKAQNWLYVNNNQWTISPSTNYSYGVEVIFYSGSVFDSIAYKALYATNNYIGQQGECVRPSVYLIPGVQLKGAGTSGDPFVFAE